VIADTLPVALAESDEDAALVRRAAGGDATAFDELVRRHWHALVRLARVVTASDLDAEDLAQETLVHAWRRLGELRSTASFLPWLHRSLVRRAVRAARGRRRRDELLRAGGDVEPAAAPAAYEPTPLAARQARELLAALTPRQRAVVFLVEVEGLSTAEAASALGAAEATVRVHLFLARRRLRAHLAGETP
jgi:RNA polymerase sigma-70 factor (ECF subfamily)